MIPRYLCNYKIQGDENFVLCKDNVNNIWKIYYNTRSHRFLWLVRKYLKKRILLTFSYSLYCASARTYTPLSIIIMLRGYRVTTIILYRPHYIIRLPSNSLLFSFRTFWPVRRHDSYVPHLRARRRFDLFGRILRLYRPSPRSQRYAFMRDNDILCRFGTEDNA